MLAVTSFSSSSSKITNDGDGDTDACIFSSAELSSNSSSKFVDATPSLVCCEDYSPNRRGSVAGEPPPPYLHHRIVKLHNKLTRSTSSPCCDNITETLSKLLYFPHYTTVPFSYLLFLDIMFWRLSSRLFPSTGLTSVGPKKDTYFSTIEVLTASYCLALSSLKLLFRYSIWHL